VRTDALVRPSVAMPRTHSVGVLVTWRHVAMHSRFTGRGEERDALRNRREARALEARRLAGSISTAVLAILGTLCSLRTQVSAKRVGRAMGGEWVRALVCAHAVGGPRNMSDSPRY
jgi:hypothetical protein